MQVLYTMLANVHLDGLYQDPGKTQNMGAPRRKNALYTSDHESRHTVLSYPLGVLLGRAQAYLLLVRKTKTETPIEALLHPSPPLSNFR